MYSAIKLLLVSLSVVLIILDGCGEKRIAERCFPYPRQHYELSS